jgi:hypothetical protein
VGLYDRIDPRRVPGHQQARWRQALAYLAADQAGDVLSTGAVGSSGGGRFVNGAVGSSTTS